MSKTVNRKEMDQICSEALRQQKTEVRKFPAAAEADADRSVSPTNTTRRPATSSAVTSPAPTAQAPTTTGRPLSAVGPKAATKQVRSAFPDSGEPASPDATVNGPIMNILNGPTFWTKCRTTRTGNVTRFGSKK